MAGIQCEKKKKQTNFCPYGVDLLVGKRQTINELIGKIYSISGVRNTMETNKAEQGQIKQNRDIGEGYNLK